MKEIKELRNMTVDELQTELLSIRREQFNLRLKKAAGSLDKTHLITLARKTVARIKTIMSEKAGENHGK